MSAALVDASGNNSDDAGFDDGCGTRFDCNSCNCSIGDVDAGCDCGSYCCCCFDMGIDYLTLMSFENFVL